MQAAWAGWADLTALVGSTCVESAGFGLAGAGLVFSSAGHFGVGAWPLRLRLSGCAAELMIRVQAWLDDRTLRRTGFSSVGGWLGQFLGGSQPVSTLRLLCERQPCLKAQSYLCDAGMQQQQCCDDFAVFAMMMFVDRITTGG